MPVSFIFTEMRKFANRILNIMTAAAVMFSGASVANSQTEKPLAKTIFRDADGDLISNNEFVDIRMANYHYRDSTLMRTLEDGTVAYMSPTPASHTAS